jgi:hypothetical protein
MRFRARDPGQLAAGMGALHLTIIRHELWPAQKLKVFSGTKMMSKGFK